ncbi:NAD(P)H-dependent flavin oxidoreductase [Desulfococcus multivorans]|uniref:2-nitropropane dioxygenase NPD n=1 Tax=Desulfococcus multivorans DSM 2059 TaxID=1121405 RepID=S7TX03_DESML|nr:nitronate monooxygenase [Desulfococcus multivorans]AOY58153.1 2-nitropropane dioxygenase [Desulfococcus multivorans]AQV00506.1 nitronate monooxygenase [Desulfococcus multivorans]EPR41280.1 2-nitropropane dioxygenase NPD [Desulfococcus multivorans DSM 2059]SJZ74091.1 enoyl-[acyl-carrier protein] reductase II [Desulfococcus multivorans DSM 2059]
MTTSNRVCRMFGIRCPLIQAGMVWCAPWQLASAVSNAGGLGIIGAASMHADVLAEHIAKCQSATTRPFGVNLPLLYPDLDDHIERILAGGVPIVFTSAGNPGKYTRMLKVHGVTVVHVVSSAVFARKAEDAGVDAVVAEGFEAGGHNGREETTTLCLVPQVVADVDIPVIAAGGIGTGRAMLAAMVLGAEGVQIGSRFVTSEESSAHPAFKRKVVDTAEGGTVLTLKELAPVRLIRNSFYASVQKAYADGASVETLRAFLGKGRAKRGMFEGDLDEGELEIGQVAAQIHEILPASRIVEEIIGEFRTLMEAFKAGPHGRFGFGGDPCQ